MDTIAHAPGDIGLAFFATAIGECGIAWNNAAITGVQLPERTPLATRTRMTRRFPDAREVTPPPHARAAIDGIIALLAGEPRDLSGVALDMRGVSSFNQRVYDVARTIAAGSTIAVNPRMTLAARNRSTRRLTAGADSATREPISAYE